MKKLTVVGAWPNFIKAAPFCKSIKTYKAHYNEVNW
jgi:hypothetical protein